MKEYPTPTEPGWYWRWRTAGWGEPDIVEVVSVRRRDDGRLGMYGGGYFQPVDDPRSWWKWGPRVHDWTPQSDSLQPCRNPAGEQTHGT